jgi:CRP/FNR family transcriptional regulator
MEFKGRVVSISTRRFSCDECSVSDECLGRNEANLESHRDAGKISSSRVIRRGERLFHCDDPFEAVFIVRSGTVKTSMITPEGSEQIIGFHGPGDVIGLDAIVTGRYVCTAEALDTSSLCALPFEQLCRLCQESQPVQRRLLGKMSSQLFNAEAMLLALGQKSAEQRIAYFLLSQSRKQFRLGYSPAEIYLSMSRVEIGSYLALAVETVSRVLTRLQGAGVLSVRRNRVDILDLEMLAAIADQPLDPEIAPRPRLTAVH